MPCTRASQRTIGAIQLVPSELGERTMGVFTQLPADAELIICDDRTSDKTVKVSCNGLFYLVFKEDLHLTSAATLGSRGSYSACDVDAVFPPPPRRAETEFE
jgi:hypothetical protein